MKDRARQLGPADMVAVAGIAIVALGLAIAFVGTAVVVIGIEMFDDLLMDEGLSGLDWTGRGSFVSIVGAIAVLAAILRRRPSFMARYHRYQLAGALLIGIYWATFPTLHVLGDSFDLPRNITTNVYPAVRPYAVLWRWVESLVAPHVPYGFVMFVPFDVLFGVTAASVNIWLVTTTWLSRKRHSGPTSSTGWKATRSAS